MIYYLTRGASWLAGRVPRPLRLALAGPLTLLVYYGWGTKRRHTIANMAHVLGTTPNDPRARRLARDSWRNYGRYVSDFFYLPNARPAEILARITDTTPPPGTDGLIEQALARGKGLLLVTMHFGAWDVAGVYIASRFPLDLLVESFADPRMDRLVQEQRAAFGQGILRIEKTPRRVLRALKENRAVAVAGDRPVPPEDGVPVTFFGQTCYVPGGIAQIALLSGAAILPGICRYDDQYSTTYSLHAGPLIVPDTTADRKTETVALMQRMFTGLEGSIRAYPAQWAMFRRFWPEAEATGQAEHAEHAVARPASATSTAGSAADG